MKSTKAKMAHHPSGEIITFTEHDHRYVDGSGRIYTSATTLIGSYFPKFDAVAQAENCSKGTNPKYAGRSPEDIRAEWEREGDRGRTEGTNIHSHAESISSGCPDIEPISERCAAIFAQVDKAYAELLKYYRFVGAEIIVFDPDTRISGTIDLLMWHERLNELIILDWKQNKEISHSNAFQKGLPPIEHLEDTDINHYSIQLSLYEWLIRNGNYFPGITRFNRSLIALTSFNHNLIPLQDYKYEVEEIIKHAA